ncbi:amidohydrolase family protein, partial [Leyella stercorea]|uniref:amidohydrolase family protein n=1 Tax=Leyella stercorea TaxID=363265 RepID=UPI00242A3EE6
MKVNINLRHLTAMQLSSRIFYILIGMIVVLFALFWIIGYDMPYDDNPDYSAPLLTDALIWFMIVLTFSTFGLAVFGAINGMRKNKGENVVVNNVPARRISVAVIIGTALLLVLTYAFSSTDALLVNGERFTDADALLVKAGRISWIGSGACAPAHDGVPSVDLEGRTVLPALCDVHTHPSWIAATVRSVPCVSPIVNTIEEMIEALRRHPLAGRGPEAWITGFGYDEGKLAEHRTPTIEDLDRVST